MAQSSVVVVVILALCFIIYRRFFRHAIQLLPPGPKPLPIVGNILHLPPNGMPEYQHWLKHKDIYGAVSSITVLGQTIVILHSGDAAHYLLEKMSLKTSARPRKEFATLCDIQRFLVSQPYERYQWVRKTTHQHLGSEVALRRHHKTHEIDAQRLLLRLLNNPDDLHQHLKTSGLSIKEQRFCHVNFRLTLA